MPRYERTRDPDQPQAEPIEFKIGETVLIAPGEAPLGTLELLSPAMGDGPVASKAGIVPQLLRAAFGDQLDAATGLTDNDGLWLFSRLTEAWFGTPTSPSPPSPSGDGITDSALTASLSQADGTPVVSTIGSGSPLPSPQ